MVKVCIVIPAYNEEKRIAMTLKEYGEFFEKSSLDYQILVVINGTTDGTEDIVKSFSKKNRKIKYINLKGSGKGYAVIEGFKQALKSNFELIGFVDADMATPPKEYLKLINNIEGFDGIIADRYMDGSVIIPKPTSARLFAKKLFNLVVRTFMRLNFKDTQCGAKVFKSDALKKVINNLSMSQWAFDVELLYLMRKEGFKIKSSRTYWLDKEYSKINFWRSGPFMVLAIVRLRLINSPFKFLVKFYDRIIERIE